MQINYKGYTAIAVKQKDNPEWSYQIYKDNKIKAGISNIPGNLLESNIVNIIKEHIEDMSIGE